MHHATTTIERFFKFHPDLSSPNTTLCCESLIKGRSLPRTCHSTAMWRSYLLARRCACSACLSKTATAQTAFFLPFYQYVPLIPVSSSNLAFYSSFFYSFSKNSFDLSVFISFGRVTPLLACCISRCARGRLPWCCSPKLQKRILQKEKVSTKTAGHLHWGKSHDFRFNWYNCRSIAKWRLGFRGFLDR